jgi:hypothetical protein
MLRGKKEPLWLSRLGFEPPSVKNRKMRNLANEHVCSKRGCPFWLHVLYVSIESIFLLEEELTEFFD